MKKKKQTVHVVVGASITKYHEVGDMNNKFISQLWEMKV